MYMFLSLFLSSYLLLHHSDLSLLRSSSWFSLGFLSCCTFFFYFVARAFCYAENYIAVIAVALLVCFWTIIIMLMFAIMQQSTAKKAEITKMGILS